MCITCYTPIRGVSCPIAKISGRVEVADTIAEHALLATR